MGYDILELDSLPREKGVLQARINEHRYQRRRERRHRVGVMVMSTGLIGAGVSFWPQLQPLFAQLDVYQWIAVVAGIVFVVSSGQLVRRVTRRSRPAAIGSHGDAVASPPTS